MSTEQEFQEHLDEYNHEVFSNHEEELTTDDSVVIEPKHSHGVARHLEALVYLLTPALVLVGVDYVIWRFL